MAEADDPVEITVTTKITGTIQKNASLLVTLTIAVVSPVFPVYAFVTGMNLIIPSVFFATILTISIIGSLIVYYEAKIKEIKENPITILKQKYVNGNCTKEQLLERNEVLKNIEKK